LSSRSCTFVPWTTSTFCCWTCEHQPPTWQLSWPERSSSLKSGHSASTAVTSLSRGRLLQAYEGQHVVDWLNFVLVGQNFEAVGNKGYVVDKVRKQIVRRVTAIFFTLKTSWKSFFETKRISAVNSQIQIQILHFYKRFEWKMEFFFIDKLTEIQGNDEN
jgi:hypothetical protein